MNEASILGQSPLTPIAIAESCHLSAISFFVFLTSSAVSQLLAVPHLTENGYKLGYVTKRSCKHALVTVLYQLRQDDRGTNMPLFRVNSLINIQKHK